MSNFVITNLFAAPNLSDDGVWQFVTTRMCRDYPWLLTDGHDICHSGLGISWSGWKKRDRVVSHAGFRSTASFPLNVVCAWLTHFFDVVRLSRKGSVIALVPSAEAGFGATLAKMCLKRRVRTIVRITAHAASKSLYVKPSRWRYRIIKQIERFVLSHADLVVPMGQFTSELARSHGVPSDKMIIQQFPVSWINHAEISDPPDRPTILTVARLVKEKGLQILLNAIPTVLKALPDARLLIAGDGIYRPELERIAKSLGIQDRVVFMGWLGGEELRSAYREASVFSLPSLWDEGMGMVFVEAGLMGRAVVASDRGGIRDIIRQDENGLLVSPGDSEALAQALIKILKDRELARRMGINGNRLARRYLAGRDQAVENVRRAICSDEKNGNGNESRYGRPESTASLPAKTS